MTLLLSLVAPFLQEAAAADGARCGYILKNPAGTRTVQAEKCGVARVNWPDRSDEVFVVHVVDLQANADGNKDGVFIAIDSVDGKASLKGTYSLVFQPGSQETFAVVGVSPGPRAPWIQESTATRDDDNGKAMGTVEVLTDDGSEGRFSFNTGSGTWTVSEGTWSGSVENRLTIPARR